MKVNLVYGTSVLSVADFDWDKMITKKLEELTPAELYDIKNGIKYIFTKNKSAQRTMAETYATTETFKMVMAGKDPTKAPLDITAKTIREWYENNLDIISGDYTPPEKTEAEMAEIEMIHEALSPKVLEKKKRITKKKAIEA